MIDKAQIVKDGESCEYLLALPQFKDYQKILQVKCDNILKEFGALAESKMSVDAKYRGKLEAYKMVIGLPEMKAKQGKFEKNRAKAKASK